MSNQSLVEGKGSINTSDSRAYPDDHQSEEVREGYEPQRYEPRQPYNPEAIHNTDVPFTIGDNDAIGGEAFEGGSEEATHWQSRDYNEADDDDSNRKAVYGSFPEERDVWGK